MAIFLRNRNQSYPLVLRPAWHGSSTATPSTVPAYQIVRIRRDRVWNASHLPTGNVIAGTGHKIFLFISIIIADIFPSKCNCFNFPDIRSNCSSPLTPRCPVYVVHPLQSTLPPSMPASLQRYPLSASSSQTKYDPPFSFPFRICSRSVAHIKHPRKTTQR